MARITLNQKSKYYILLVIVVICIIALSLMDRIPQDLSYHNFADQRKLMGVPNFWDVVSNVPMCFIGIFALFFSIKNWSKEKSLSFNLMIVFLSLGIFSASFGSAYYHWEPNNNSLVWDRLPMTFMFMPFLAMIIYESLGKKIGEWSFWILVLLGVFSIYYWHYTETIGEGDLRVYAFVQFFPMLFAPCLLYLFPIKTDHLKLILLVLFWYVLAKLAEYLDLPIFEFTGFWSGHTIKHFLAAIALIYVVKYLMSWHTSFSTDKS